MVFYMSMSCMSCRDVQHVFFLGETLFNLGGIQNPKVQPLGELDSPLKVADGSCENDGFLL